MRLAGGAATVRQFLQARLVDELHLVIAPILIGAGERLFDGLDDLPAGYRCESMVGSDAATYVRLRCK